MEQRFFTGVEGRVVDAELYAPGIKCQLVDGFYQQEKVANIKLFVGDIRPIGAIGDEFFFYVYSSIEIEDDQFCREIVHFRRRKVVVFQATMKEEMSEGLILVVDDGGI